MTLTLNLTPEIEERLAEQARVKGVGLEEYVRSVVERVAKKQVIVPPVDKDAMNAMLDRLAEMGKDLPVIPLSALTREAMYEDHD